MARMAYTVARTSHRSGLPDVALALVALQTEVEDQEWSIDCEAMGSGWHESSWLLRRGLEVDESPPPEAIPPEWQWKWWLESGEFGTSPSRSMGALGEANCAAPIAFGT